MKTVTVETLFSSLPAEAKAEYTAQMADATARKCLPAYDLAAVVKGLNRDLARAARSPVEAARVIAEAKQLLRNVVGRTPSTPDTKAYPALDDAFFSLRAAATLLALAQD